MRVEIDVEKIRERGIFLMTPMYDGVCSGSYATGVSSLTAICAVHNIPFDVFFIYNESLITRARNYAVDEFTRRQFKRVDADGKETHHNYQLGIFIDADIEFKAIDVLMLAHQICQDEEKYPVVCGAYPKKVLATEKMKLAVDRGLVDNNPDDMLKYSGDYVISMVEDVVDLREPISVMESGTGFMMFTRDLINQVIDANEDLKYLPDHARTKNFSGDREISAIFSALIDPETKRYLSEDYFFCKLVRQLNKNIWILPWIHLKHHGTFVFGGSLQDTMISGMGVNGGIGMRRN